MRLPKTRIINKYQRRFLRANGDQWEMQCTGCLKWRDLGWYTYRDKMKKTYHRRCNKCRSEHAKERRERMFTTNHKELYPIDSKRRDLKIVMPWDFTRITGIAKTAIHCDKCPFLPHCEKLKFTNRWVYCMKPDDRDVQRLLLSGYHPASIYIALQSFRTPKVAEARPPMMEVKICEGCLTSFEGLPEDRFCRPSCQERFELKSKDWDRGIFTVMEYLENDENEEEKPIVEDYRPDKQDRYTRYLFLSNHYLVGGRLPIFPGSPIDREFEFAFRS